MTKRPLGRRGRCRAITVRRICPALGLRLVPTLSFTRLLTRLDPNPKTRGDEFECICAWYLRTHRSTRAGSARSGCGRTGRAPGPALAVAVLAGFRGVSPVRALSSRRGDEWRTVSAFPTSSARWEVRAPPGVFFPADLRPCPVSRLGPVAQEVDPTRLAREGGQVANSGEEFSCKALDVRQRRGDVTVIAVGHRLPSLTEALERGPSGRQAGLDRRHLRVFPRRPEHSEGARSLVLYPWAVVLRGISMRPRTRSAV